jgi:hypothetical protein
MSISTNKISNGLIFGTLAGLFLQFSSSNINSIKFYSDATNYLWNLIQNMSWYPTTMHINFGGYITSGIIGLIFGYYLEKK